MPRRRSLSVLAVTAAALAVTLVPVAAHAAAPPAGLGSGASLGPGESLASPAGTYTVTMQTDGNLVERTTRRAGAVWSTRTAGRTGATLTMQTDGNLVLRTAAAGAIWTTSTAGNPGATLRIQDDGNIVVAARSGRAVWAKGVDRGQVVPPPPSSGTLRVGQSWTQPDSGHFSPSREFQAFVDDGVLGLEQEIHPGGRIYQVGTWEVPATGPGSGVTDTRLTLQTDGNLVLYAANRAVWTTHTSRRNATVFSIQDDGNLVLRNSSGGAVWSSGTGRVALGAGQVLGPGQGLRAVDESYREQAALSMRTDGNLVFSRDGRAVWSAGTSAPGSRLVVQTDGNLVVVGPDGRARWSSGTAGTGAGNVLLLGRDGPLRLLVASSGRVLWSVG